jgi:hypothetical protein
MIVALPYNILEQFYQKQIGDHEDNNLITNHISDQRKHHRTGHS